MGLQWDQGLCQDWSDCVGIGVGWWPAELDCGKGKMDWTDDWNMIAIWLLGLAVLDCTFCCLAIASTGYWIVYHPGFSCSLAILDSFAIQFLVLLSFCYFFRSSCGRIPWLRGDYGLWLLVWIENQMIAQPQLVFMFYAILNTSSPREKLIIFTDFPTPLRWQFRQNIHCLLLPSLLLP